MRLGLRQRLLLAFVALMAVAMALAYGFAAGALRDHLVQRAEADLRVRVALTASVLDQQVPAVSWDAATQAVALQAQVRVTVIGANGVLLADSQLSAPELVNAGNHAQRPEVILAREHGFGQDTRHSATLRQSMMYVAVPLTRHPGVVVRAARSLEDVHQALAPLRRSLAAGAGVGLLVALIMSSLVAGWAAARARAVTAAAREMTAGRLEARVPEGGADEFAEVGRALNGLALSLSTTVQQLKTERDLLNEVLGSMQEGVLLLDGGGRVAMLNASLRNMLLLPPDARGKVLADVVEQPALVQTLRQMLQDETLASAELELQGLKPRRVLLHATRLTGGTSGLLVVCVDVTDLRRLESLRRDFVANASHELRTPVASVRAATEMLAQAMDQDPTAARRFVDIIERNATRLHLLVTDLLDLSRLESQQFHLSPEPVDVSGLVQHVFGLFRGRAEHKRILLKSGVGVGPETPAAQADRRALEQVLSNLIDNAIQHCAEGTEVKVTAGVDPGGLRLSVEDNGAGIEARHLPRLFERFYRADPGRSREAGGTGLGLSIVRHLVEAMGGEVSVDSTVGGGTRFSFTVPAAV